jgi:hypothetical protein
MDANQMFLSNLLQDRNKLEYFVPRHFRGVKGISFNPFHPSMLSVAKDSSDGPVTMVTGISN